MVGVGHEMCHSLEELRIRSEFEKCGVVRIRDCHPSMVRRFLRDAIGAWHNQWTTTSLGTGDGDDR